LEKTGDVAFGGAPRDADGQALLVYRQDGAPALGTALEQEIDAAFAEPDGPRLADQPGLVEQA